MNLVWFPLAAAAGGIVGTIAHEATHAVLAIALGELEGVGWQGGLAGGPYVDFRTDSRVASEIVRKLPLVAGLVVAVVAAATIEASVPWLFLAGLAAGLLWSSPEDLRYSASVASADAD